MAAVWQENPSFSLVFRLGWRHLADETWNGQVYTGKTGGGGYESAGSDQRSTHSRLSQGNYKYRLVSSCSSFFISHLTVLIINIIDHYGCCLYCPYEIWTFPKGTEVKRYSTMESDTTVTAPSFVQFHPKYIRRQWPLYGPARGLVSTTKTEWNHNPIVQQEQNSIDGLDK